MPVWDYNLTIIAGGPAGLADGIYAGRARCHAVMLQKAVVENLFRVSASIRGFEPWVAAPLSPSRWKDILKNLSRAES